MPAFTLMYVPAEQCQIIDTWDSTGMRGTGSHDFAVEDVFVPEDRTFEIFTAQSQVSGPLYRMRLEMLAITSIVTVSLGIARSAIDTLVALAKEKTPTLSQIGLAARPTLHVEVARAEARYQSARAYLFEVADEIMEAVTTGDGVPEDLEARRRLACANLAEACQEVVDRMYRLGGSTSVYRGNRLDRCLRDMHTVNQHLAASPVWWEKTGQYYFGYGLGMP
jgi:alkylation response protein AidB-like acyl-CoA dehydrogenase